MGDFRNRIFIIAIILLQSFTVVNAVERVENDTLATRAPQDGINHGLSLRSNLLPWVLTIPNIGAEYLINDKWSVAFDVLYCPWKISDKFSVKSVALLPEGRWWIKKCRKGSFLNIHLNIAWFNVRANRYRYQDSNRPLFGAGIGYGYHLEINKRWGIEFEIGAGMANMRYDRFYNVKNGALKDTRVTTYWGIDRAGIIFTYYLCDL
ncbi:MAG: DUF3575 domain-containing protein [Muribaculaceae bacterium]|nr:DUF3575 domain-containing protein [Muribaculaceae bacterium]